MDCPRCHQHNWHCLLSFKHIQSCSDDEAIEAIEMDRRWQLVLDCLDCEKAPFSKGTLVKFRALLISYGTILSSAAQMVSVCPFMKAVLSTFQNMNVLLVLYVLNAQRANMVEPFPFTLMNLYCLNSESVKLLLQDALHSVNLSVLSIL